MKRIIFRRQRKMKVKILKNSMTKEICAPNLESF